MNGNGSETSRTETKKKTNNVRSSSEKKTGKKKNASSPQLQQTSLPVAWNQKPVADHAAKRSEKKRGETSASGKIWREDRLQRGSVPDEKMARQKKGLMDMGDRLSQGPANEKGKLGRFRGARHRGRKKSGRIKRGGC